MKNLTPFKTDKEEVLLLVIDVQESFRPVIDDIDGVLQRAGVLAAAAELMGIPIIATEQYPKGLGPTMPEMKEAMPSASYFEKRSFDACTEEVTKALKSSARKHIIVCGIESHVCVLQTSLSLLDKGYDVTLASDACASRKLRNHENAMDQINRMGGNVSNVESIVFKLLKTSASPIFKQISALVKPL